MHPQIRVIPSRKHLVLRDNPILLVRAIALKVDHILSVRGSHTVNDLKMQLFSRPPFDRLKAGLQPAALI